ncbi:MAG TPA: S8 family serine peptidase [Bryobacteraceae bacterium]|nr:S8 family serine peptidase [Bryobacteraceae bacterium]
MELSDQEPALPFAGATGRGLRVAVVDSGVNARHPHISGVAGGVSILGPDRIEEDSFLDELGHGTAVMAAIQEKAPEAEYFAVRLFQKSLRTTTPALLAAIEWALGKNVDVINLSLGTLNFAFESHFRGLVERAALRGTVLVSAREAGDQACLPGSLPGVIGVSLDWDCPRTRYRCREENGARIYCASGYPRSLPGMPRERNLQGISFAVANMTGFVLRARESCPADDLAQALASEATPWPARPLDPHSDAIRQGE